MLGIGPLLERFPRQLSGGQRQRVAIGRAIVRDARLFLFDEPLSNLDAQLRDEMRGEIKRLHQELGKTMIYVTHDQIEAMTLADRIVLLKDGVIEQQGAPLDLFERPATRFVAGFLGSPQMNFVPCHLEARQRCAFADGRTLPLPPAKAARLDRWRGRAMVLGIRPEHFSRADGAAPRPGQVPLRVADRPGPADRHPHLRHLQARRGRGLGRAAGPRGRDPRHRARPSGRPRPGDPDRPAVREGGVTRRRRMTDCRAR